MVFWLGLAFVVLMSGLIAYLGDLIGRRIGRRRLSLFGLRPRNTAIIFTVATGMLISLLAVGVVLAVSSGVRNRLLRYDEIVAELTDRADQQRRLADERATELKKVDQQLRETERSRRQAEKRLGEAYDGAAKAYEAQERAVKAQRRAEQEARRAEAAAAGKTKALAAADAQLRRAQLELKAAADRRDDAERRMHEAEGRLRTSQTRLAKLQERIGRAEAALTETETELKKKQQELVNAEERALPLIGQLQEELAKVQAELDRARRERRELLEEAVAAARGRVIYDRQEELGRRWIDGSLGELEARNRIETFTRELDRKAKEAGAGPDAGGRYAVPMQLTEDGELAPFESFLPVVTKRLAVAGEPVWLRAVALLNCIAGRPVYYAFEYYADRVVFLQHSVIAAAVIDGREAEPAIARKLEELLKDQVLPAAAKGGMLPRPERRIGPEVWFPVVKQVKAEGQPVTVEVLAARTVRIGDPLTLEFRVQSDASP